MATEISFDGALTVASAETFRDRLIEALAMGGDVVVDCDAAETVDLSFVQLLVAARKTASAGGTVLSLRSSASGALLDTLRRGGFVDALAGEGGESRFWIREGV